MVLLVDLEVLGQVFDALAERGNLHLRRARIAVVQPVRGNDLLWLPFRAAYSFSKQAREYTQRPSRSTSLSGRTTARRKIDRAAS
jgi:hypothetical protein